jgi:F-type H+-transporting ATPase subunit a
MINWNGKRRWIALLMLIAGIVVMLTVPPVIPVIQLPGEVYPASWTILGLRMTNTLMGSIVVWILLILLVVYARRKMPKSGDEVPPGGFYNLFEMLFEGLYGFILNIVGEKYMRYIFSFFMTIFLIVLLSNWLELIPGVDSVGFLEPHGHVNVETGEVEGDGYETMSIGAGAYALNPKCPWVSPAEAATLTAEQQTARAEAGCLTGTGAPVAEAAHEEEAVVEEVHEEATPAAEEGTAVAEEGAAVAETAAEEEHHYEAGDPSVPWVVLPFLRAPSTDLNMTASLALIAVVMTQVLGFRALGPSYLTKFFNFKTLFTSPLGGIDVAVGLLELIGEFAKILSFSFRLLGNIFAGSILLFVMSFLVPFLPWPFFILEFGVGIIQAIVFGMLTAIFMSQATAGHGDHHEEHAAEAAEAAH